uniref:Uncharacterized protein n=1 Tax=Populus trichocarpa TaxID=3694 RepID=A0A2K2A1B3_POPTR
MMDEQVLDVICEKLIPSLYDEGVCVDRMADPINEMFFIVRSLLDSCCIFVLLYINPTTPIFLPSLNSSLIRPGDLCGEELLTWALDPCSSVPLFQHARLLPSLKLKPLLSFPRT